jgi:hypothetical protein
MYMPLNINFVNYLEEKYIKELFSVNCAQSAKTVSYLRWQIFNLTQKILQQVMHMVKLLWRDIVHWSVHI